MRHMGKKPIFLLRFSALTLVFLIGFETAEISHAQKAEQMANEIQNPGMLPISPFYFLKEWRRDVIRSFTKNPLSQAMFELNVLDEKILELKKIGELRPDDTRVAEEAIRNYEDSQNRLKIIIRDENLRAEDAENREKLVGEMLKKMAEHEKIMSDVLRLYRDDDIRSSAEKTREMIFELAKISKIIPEDIFEDLVRKYFTEENSSIIIGKTPVLTPVPMQEVNSSDAETPNESAVQTEQ